MRVKCGNKNLTEPSSSSKTLGTFSNRGKQINESNTGLGNGYHQFNTQNFSNRKHILEA